MYFEYYNFDIILYVGRLHKRYEMILVDMINTKETLCRRWVVLTFKILLEQYVSTVSPNRVPDFKPWWSPNCLGLVHMNWTLFLLCTISKHSCHHPNHIWVVGNVSHISSEPNLSYCCCVWQLSLSHVGPQYAKKVQTFHSFTLRLFSHSLQITPHLITSELHRSKVWKKRIPLSFTLSAYKYFVLEILYDFLAENVGVQIKPFSLFFSRWFVFILHSLYLHLKFMHVNSKIYTVI